MLLTEWVYPLFVLLFKLIWNIWNNIAFWGQSFLLRSVQLLFVPHQQLQTRAWSAVCLNLSLQVWIRAGFPLSCSGTLLLHGVHAGKVMWVVTVLFKTVVWVCSVDFHQFCQNWVSLYTELWYPALVQVPSTNSEGTLPWEDGILERVGRSRCSC